MSEHEVFLAAIEIDDPKQRAAYVEDACNGNAMLRQQVDSLLAAHEQSGGFLDVPALRQLADEQGSDVTNIERKSTQSEIDLSFLEPSDAPGSLGRLLHYEVRQVIGRGGCGIVLKAFDEKLERIVAIKVMAPELAATSPARKRFLREARATAAIRHENVVSIYAVEEQPLPFLVMEYIAGETLQQRLDRTGPLDVRDVLRIGQQVASGLAAAHAQGLIHRDTKPANILLEDGTNHLKITDFGLARSADDASMTQSGVIAGTPLYMSPEQAQAHDIDCRSDLFSLGSVLYVMCSGRPPFRAASSIAVLRRVVEDQPRPIQNIIPEVPEWLVAIIARLHAKNPAERFASAEEVRDLLGRCSWQLEQHGRVEMASDLLPTANAGTSAPVGESARLLPAKESASPRRRHWIAAAALVLAAVSGLGMAEATGVTNVRSTVIRLFSPDGTLIVEVDEPGVSVSIDGEEMVITGAGVKEIRLKPGQYTLLARKDSEVVHEELVTVTTNGRQLVRVSREGDAGRPKPAVQTSQAVVPPAPSALLASLRRDQIPPALLAAAGNGDPDKAPPSLVAVLGDPEPIQTMAIFSVAFSPDGHWLASGSADHTILLRDAKSGKVRRVLRGHTSSVTCVAFLPDSKTLVSGSSDGMVKLWPVDEKQETTTLKFPVQRMEMAVSPDGRFIAAGGAGGKVRLWKWSQWDTPVELPAVSTGTLSAIAFSPNGELLACGWDDKQPESPVGLFNTTDGTLKQTLPGHKSAVLSLAFTTDSSLLASSGRSDNVRLWNIAAASTSEIPLTGAHRLAFSPGGSKLALLGHFGGHIYDVEARAILKDVNSLTYYAYVGGYRPAFSPDGKTLIIGDSWGAVNFYDTATWTMKRECLGPGHRSAVLKLAVSPDGHAVITRGLDKTLRRWDLAAQGKPSIVQQFQKPDNLLAFSPTGDFYAAGAPTLAWKAETGDKLFELRGDQWSLHYSPDGKALVSETFWDHVVHLWDAETGRELHRFPPLKDGHNALAFSADGGLLAAVDLAGSVVVWNAVTGIEGARWIAGRASSAAFSPAGETLAIGHPDGTITFWNAATGDKQRSLLAHAGPVFQLRFTPDGKALLSSGTDGVIQVRTPDHDRPRAVIAVGTVNPAGPPVTFDLDASGQYLFASGPTPLIYVHRLPPE